MPLPVTLLAIALSQCTFHRSGPTFTGSCGKLFDQTPQIKLSREPAITTGAWRDGIAPVSTWSGEMTDEGYGKAPIELEVYAGGWGLLRTIYAWTPVSEFTLVSTMSFRVDATHEVAPDTSDRKIVQCASAILANDAVWNRSDNRICPPGETKWSIYCAMEKARSRLPEASATGVRHSRSYGF
jgi:hypothetical protein